MVAEKKMKTKNIVNSQLMFFQCITNSWGKWNLFVFLLAQELKTLSLKLDHIYSSSLPQIFLATKQIKSRLPRSKKIYNNTFNLIETIPKHSLQLTFSPILSPKQQTNRDSNSGRSLFPFFSYTFQSTKQVTETNLINSQSNQQAQSSNLSRSNKKHQKQIKL